MDDAVTIEGDDVLSWCNDLMKAERLCDVDRICKEISAKKGQISRKNKFFDPDDQHEHDTEHRTEHRNLLKRLYDLMLAKDVPHSQRKYISKACFSLCRNSREYVEVLEPGIVQPRRRLRRTERCNEKESIVLYGMIHSPFLKRSRYTDDVHADAKDRLHILFQSSATGYTRWFHTSVECLLTTLEQTNAFPSWWALPDARVWAVALVNLESPYHGAREIILRLLKHLVRNNQFAIGTLLPALERWHWLNRNKYHLLAILLRECHHGEVLQHSTLTIKELESALVQTLRYKHLLSGGQAMLRAMPSENVHHLVANVVRTGNIGLLRSMAKYWFTTLSPQSHSAIFQLLELNKLVPDEHKLPTYLREEKYDRLFLLVSLFQRDFQNNCNSPEDLLLMLTQLAYSVKPIPAVSMGLLIKTLTFHLTGSRWNPVDKLLLARLQRCVLEAIETPGSIGLCTIAVEQWRLLLDKSSSASEDKSCAIQNFLYSMNERYLRNKNRDSLSYQQTITALRLFTLLIEHCFKLPLTERYQLVPRATQTGSWLTEKQLDSFRNDVFHLNYLLRSEYEDVRLAVAGLLYNQLGPSPTDARFLARMTSTARNTLDEYSTLLAEAERKVLAAIENTRLDLYANALLADDADDRAIWQLHRAVERATQTCFGDPYLFLILDSLDPFWALVRAVDSVVQCVLSLLNVTRPATAPETGPQSFTTGTSFEIMECSMQTLLDRSPEWARFLASRGSPASSTEVALAKRAMQAELWKALRAVAVFTEEYALWLLEHHERFPVVAETDLRACMKRFGSILVNCCHRGAIESSAACLGRVVRRIMRDKAQRSRRLLHQPGLTCPPESHVEELFRETLAMQPAEQSDFRRARGYLFLLHSIMEAEADEGIVGDSLLRHYLEDHVALSQRAQLLEPDDGRRTPIGMLELHQLNLLVKAAPLNEAILPYVDELMVVALEAFRRPDWPVRNAALQLYTSCTTKLARQRQQYDDTQCDWPPVYVSLDEVVFKLPLTIQYIRRALQLAIVCTIDRERAGSTSFVLLLLEFLTRFEYRAYNVVGQEAIVVVFRSCVWHLLRHQNDLVRRQAARCYVQLYELCLLDRGEQFHSMLGHLLRSLFTELCPNRQHGLCLAAYFCVRRYVTLRHFTQHSSIRQEDTMASIRQLVVRTVPCAAAGWCPASFRCRTTLLECLSYVGFSQTDPVLSRLLHHVPAPPNNLGQETYLMALDRAATSGSVGGIGNVTMPYEIELELYHEPEQDD